MQLGLSIMCTHIYWAGNCCADALATMGHDLLHTTLFHIMSSSLSVDFIRDRNGLPNFRLP